MSRTDQFDGYRKWLGIANRRRPPSHYELLGINLNEDDHEVILAAAEQRRFYVESKRGIGHDDLVAEILMRIGEAEVTLLNHGMRRDYDRQLGLFEKRSKTRRVDTNAIKTGFESKPGRAIGEDNGIVRTYAGIVAVLCLAFAGMSLFAFNVLPWSKPSKAGEPVAAGPEPAPAQTKAEPQEPSVPPKLSSAPTNPLQRNADPIDEEPKNKTTDLVNAPQDDSQKAKAGEQHDVRGASEFEGHYYRVFLETMSWRAAQARCKEMGGHLATVSSGAENSFITTLSKKTIGNITNTGVWLGGTDERKEGQWEWVDETPFTYSAWRERQPNNGGGKDGGENYLFLLLQFRTTDGREIHGWCDQSDESKDHTAYFACEWETEPAARAAATSSNNVVEPSRLAGEPEKEIAFLIDDSLAQWESSPAGGKSKWSLKNGILRISNSGPSLVTKQKFRDFDLHLEFKLPPKCNSGVFLRGRYEVQIVDSQARNGAGQPLPPNARTGTIWGKIGSTVDAYKGTNKWNTLDVKLIGREVTVRLNDSLIIDSQTIDGVTGGALDANESEPGPILLQNTNSVGAEFRNIKITPIRNEVVGTTSANGDRSDASGSLQSKFGSQFVVGVGLGGFVPNDYTQAEQNLIIKQFGSVSPENCMKMNAIQPREDEFHFEQADAIVAFAEKNNLKITGHTLVWVPDNWTPEWVFRDGDKPASKELVLARMRKHIQTVVSRYRGKISSWDVVNEALGDGDTVLRPSKWSTIAGPEFVANAFTWTHEADPDALLIYNDTNLEQPKRREKLLQLIRQLRAKKIPIHGVGVQGHWEVDYVPFSEIDALFTAIKKQGLKVMVTELDLAVVSRARWWTDGGKHREEIRKTDPLINGCPAELLDRQARVYGELFRLFQKNSSSIDRVTFWNLHDGRSWLNSWPWKHTEYPLLFDRECKPKPAFLTVIGGNNQQGQLNRSRKMGP